MFSSKKGESLVEVIVALGIFAFIFMGVINMIASSITLNLSSRQRTEAISKTQKNLNEYLAGNTNLGACTISGRQVPAVADLEGTSGCNTAGFLNTAKDSTKTCYWVELQDLSTAAPSEVNSALKLDKPTFIKVVSHGKWYTRVLGEQSFEISRIIRND